MQQVVVLNGAVVSKPVRFFVGDEWSTRSAIDFVFDVVGAQDQGRLEAVGVVAAESRGDWDALRGVIFDRDAEGTFIREGVAFLCRGEAIDPDGPLGRMMTVSGGQREVDWFIQQAGETQPPQAGSSDGQRAQAMMRFAVMMLMHQVKKGYVIDVTRDDPDLMEVIAAAERDHWLDIDVKRACYVLSEAGERHYGALMREAQELVLRYDIYGDVDVLANGEVLFDTGLGDDWRIAMFEYADLDPFYVRFLIGLNDGEWDDLSDWPACVRSQRWYAQVFGPIEAALSVEDIGKDRLEQALRAGKSALREDGAWL
jgi:hypothetical protein